MASWVVPDIWADPPRFPYQLIKALGGLAALPHVAWPASGALVFVVMFAPIPTPARSRLYLFFGLLGVAVPTLLTHPGLPIHGVLAFGLSMLCFIASVALFRLLRSGIPGHALIAALPAFLVFVSCYGLITGEHTAAYLWSFKAPICLYLSIVIAVFAALEVTFSS